MAMPALAAVEIELLLEEELEDEAGVDVGIEVERGAEEC